MASHTGTAHPITQHGDPVLHQRCARVLDYHRVPALITDMFASMRAAGGVGLAASQIGIALRVFVYDCPDAAGIRQAGHVINPQLRIPHALAPPLASLEGCLSLPGRHADLARPAHAIVTGYDQHGHPVTVMGTGLLARCLQHECDHLDGILFTDRLPAAEHAAVLAINPVSGRGRVG